MSSITRDSTNRLQYFLFENKQRLLSWLFVRWGWFAVALTKYTYHLVFKKDQYGALAALLRYERDVSCLVGEGKLGVFYSAIFRSFMNRNCTKGRNSVLSSFLASGTSSAWRKRFVDFGFEHLLRMKYPKKNINDPKRQGDLLVLKPYIGPKEKGVLFIKYDEGVQRFVSIYDVEQLARYYRIVIEPSTSGYQNSMLFLCLGLPTDVVIFAQYQPDYEYIKRLNLNYYPIRLGAGDWVDPDIFEDGVAEKKKYDLVMIANWLKWKRHETLFHALSLIRAQVGKIAVIGVPIEGRTLADVQAECEKYGVMDLVDFYERIPHGQVAEILRESKVGILLSKDEGANRGIYECFFSGVPIILSAENRGVNRDHVNEDVARVVSDEQLPGTIVQMIATYDQYTTRAWALNNTGYKNSAQKLNAFIRELATSAEEGWTKDTYVKVNGPHARYAYEHERVEAEEAFYHLEPFLRESAPKDDAEK